MNSQPLLHAPVMLQVSFPGCVPQKELWITLGCILGQASAPAAVSQLLVVLCHSFCQIITMECPVLDPRTQYVRPWWQAIKDMSEACMKWDWRWQNLQNQMFFIRDLEITYWTTERIFVRLKVCGKLTSARIALGFSFVLPGQPYFHHQPGWPFLITHIFTNLSLNYDIWIVFFLVFCRFKVYSFSA